MHVYALGITSNCIELSEIESYIPCLLICRGNIPLMWLG